MPDLAVRFLAIRGGVCAVYVVGLLAVYSPAARRLSHIAVVLGSLASVAGISLMASYMGGFDSHYFAGNLIVLFVIGIFLPWEVSAAAVLCVLMIATYAGIELTVDGLTRSMIGPLFYLVGSSVFTCLAVLSARRTLRRDLSLRLRLARANDELKDLDAAKSRFFANVTHELRTPLTLLLGPLDALRSEETGPERSELLAAMSANARRLLRQVDALLEVARLESGRLRLDPQPSHLGRILAELAAAAAPHAARRGLTLRTEGLETLPDSVFDPEKVETIAANLLSNAVKFTPAGGHVTVRGSVAGARIAFEVEDDGPGIPEEQLEKVFERFHQVDAPHTRAEGGTGLGLALARELARLHGGDVTVRSLPGHGSTFRVELPLEPRARPEHLQQQRRQKEEQVAQVRSETQTARAYAARRETLIADIELPSLSLLNRSEAQAAPPGAPKVLVVEDNADLRAFVVHHLASHYQVEAVADAESGLAAARRDPPDLVLSDVMLPGIDGLELCRQLRADADLAGLPIVLMTAKAGADAVVEGLGVGADDYVIKPFVLRELEARIAAHLRAKAIERRLHEREGRLAAIGQMTSGLVHDLRNPLTQLKGSADLAYFLALQGGELATIVEELEIVRQGSDRLRRMIQEILDYARGGTPSLRLEKVGVSFFLEGALAPLLSDLQERGIEADLQIDIPDDVQATLDPDRVQRVLENLIRNAREAVQGGKRDKRVWLSARLEGKALALRVVDNGPGISADAARHLFKPFATGKKQGTGLGLVTARTLVDAHGGELHVENKAPEGGAAFVVLLPLERPADLEAQVLSGALL